MKKDKQSIVFRELSKGSGNASSLTSVDNLSARCVYNNVRTSGTGHRLENYSSIEERAEYLKCVLPFLFVGILLGV